MNQYIAIYGPSIWLYNVKYNECQGKNVIWTVVDQALCKPMHELATHTQILDT